MTPPPSPPTPDAARRWLLEHQVRQPSAVTVEHLPHPAFESDTVSGGVVMLVTGPRRTRLVHVLADGGYGYRPDPGDDVGRRAAIEDLWAHERVRTGSLRPDEPHPCDRAARIALARGVTWIADLDVADRPGVGPAELAERRRLALRAGRPVPWRGVRPRPPVGVAADLDLLVAHVRQLADLLGDVTGLGAAFVPDQHNRDAGYSFLALEAGELRLTARERGQTVLDRRTTDVDELLFWVLDDVVQEMAGTWEASHRRGSEDSRRGWVPVWASFLDLLEPRWRRRSRVSQEWDFHDDLGRNLPLL